MLQKSTIRDVDTFTFILTDPSAKSYQLMFPSMAEKDEWKKRLSELSMQLLSSRSGPSCRLILHNSIIVILVLTLAAK